VLRIERRGIAGRRNDEENIARGVDGEFAAFGDIGTVPVNDKPGYL
jgi:hypothetical protein